MPIVRKITAMRRGGPEVLLLREGPPPEPMAGEARVAVEAAGVMPADVLWQRGAIHGSPMPPFTPGYDVIGRVEAVAGGVESVREGDRVAALVGQGGYAERVLVAADTLVPVPEGVEPAVAVALVTGYVTAYQVLARVARAEAGQRALIHGAGGGTGSAFLDVARALELQTWGTASAGKHDLVRSLGATPIDYRTQDFVAAVRADTVNGVDVVVDPIGGRHFARSWKAVRRGGTLVATAMMAAPDGRSRFEALRAFAGIPLRNLAPNGRRAVWFEVVAYNRKRPGLYREDLARLFEWLAAGRIRPVVAAELPLERAADAQRLLLDRAATGKVVLRM